MSPFRMAAASCAGRCWYNASSIPATFGGAELSGKRYVSTRERGANMEWVVQV